MIAFAIQTALIMTIFTTSAQRVRPGFEDEFYDYGESGEEEGSWEQEDHDHHHHHHHDHEPTYRNCSTKTYHNNTILFNTNYPQTFAGGSRCTYQVYRQHKVCQLRIDFLVFSLAQPSGDGFCETDYFTVEGGTTVVPNICGENTGQHIYVDVAGVAPVTVVVATKASNTFNRRWQLRVAQVKCKSPWRAPINCLQYHLTPSGFIRSFNYGTDENGNFNSIGVTGTRQIAGLQYSICIRRQFLSCAITYTKPTSDPNAFTLTDDVNGVDPSILGTTAVQSQTCTADYIVIPSPRQVTNGVVVALASDRFCGLGIGNIVSQTQPFAVRVVTDTNETPDVANRGFYLNYLQSGCVF